MSSKTTPPDSKDTTRVVIAAVAVLAVVWFAFANRQRVNISWWLFDRQSRLIYVIVVSAALRAKPHPIQQSRNKKN